MNNKKDKNINDNETKSMVCPIISIICIAICVLLLKWGTDPTLSKESGINIVSYAFLFGFGGIFFWWLS